MSHAEYLEECWNQANPDEDERTDDEVEAAHTVDDHTRQVVSVYCYGARTVVVAGDRLIMLSRN